MRAFINAQYWTVSFTEVQYYLNVADANVAGSQLAEFINTVLWPFFVCTKLARLKDPRQVVYCTCTWFVISQSLLLTCTSSSYQSQIVLVSFENALILSAYLRFPDDEAQKRCELTLLAQIYYCPISMTQTDYYLLQYIDKIQYTFYYELNTIIKWISRLLRRHRTVMSQKGTERVPNP